MSTFCTCNHHDTDHARRTGRCRAPDSYGLPCTCPSLEPDPDSADITAAQAREQHPPRAHPHTVTGPACFLTGGADPPAFLPSTRCLR